MKHLAVLIVLLATAGCGSDDRPVDVPVVAAGAYEADCQRLCTRAAGEDDCTAKHAEFCVAKCRARTNDLPATCATCLIAAGVTIHGDTGSFGDPSCVVGGPASLGACRTECDDGGAAAPAASLASFCALTCQFYMSDVDPLACSADGSADCDMQCAATIVAKGRVCAQCVIEQTGTSRTCINNDCDCAPLFDADPAFGCDELCDDQPPPA